MPSRFAAGLFRWSPSGSVEPYTTAEIMTVCWPRRWLARPRPGRKVPLPVSRQRIPLPLLPRHMLHWRYKTLVLGRVNFPAYRKALPKWFE